MIFCTCENNFSGENQKKEKEAERKKGMEEKRIAKDTVDTCQELLVRTSPLSAKLEAALNQPRVREVPKHIVSEANAAHKQVGAIKALAEKHIHGSTQISDEDKPITEDKTIVPNAQESHKALIDFLDTLDNHQKQ